MHDRGNVAPRMRVCACDGCPLMGEIPAQRRLGPLPCGTALVRLACPRVFEPRRILALLLSGAEGVLIVGCAEGGEVGAASDYEVEERIKVLRCVLQQAGLSTDRVAVEWVPGDGWGHADLAVERLRSKLGGAQDSAFSPSREVKP